MNYDSGKTNDREPVSMQHEMSAKLTQRKEQPGLNIVRAATSMNTVTGLSNQTMINEGNYILFSDTEMTERDNKKPASMQHKCD